MTQLDRIVVGVSGSAASREAVELAVELARAESAEIAFVSVVSMSDRRVPRDELGPLAFAVPHVLVTDETDIALLEAGELAKQSGVSARLEVVAADDPASAIVEAARRLRGDLIVLGGHGVHHFGRVRSVAKRVLAWAECPVLLAADSRTHDFRKEQS